MARLIHPDMLASRPPSSIDSIKGFGQEPARRETRTRDADSGLTGRVSARQDLGAGFESGFTYLSMKSLLVVVSQSARHRWGSGLDSLESLLAGTHFRARLLYPRSQAEVEEAIRKSLGDGTEAVVIVGGDGTVNQVVNALRGNTLPVTILPAGTANDFSRELGFSSEPTELLTRLKAGRTREVDLLDVNGSHFGTIGGLGLPANVALSVSHWRRTHRLLASSIKVLGSSVYHFSVLANILFRPGISSAIQLTYRAPGDSGESHLDMSISGVLIANQGCLAGGLRISPESRNDDGVFEIVLLPPGSRAYLLKMLFRLVRGDPLSSSDATLYQANEARLRCPQPCAFFGDGELLKTASEFRLSIRPGLLRVIY